jgi:outer membrane lipoprotein-sorting protein
MKKLYSNGHIYVVDKDFIFRNGGMGYVMNFSDKPITGKYRISGTTQPNQKLYGVMNEPIDVEILPDPNRSGFYNIYWTPKEPFQPGGFFSYGWATDGSKALVKTEQGYQLKMNNHFGNRCVETFFLAVPEGMQIVEKSEEYTGKQNIDGWDIYWWKKEVMPNTDHTVNVTLTEKKNIPDGPKAISFYPQNGDVNVPYGQSQIRIGFDKAMDPNIARLFFKGSKIYPDQYKFNYDASKKEFVFYFTLKPNSHYVVYADKIWGTFKDINGQSSEGFEFSFDTNGFSSNAANKPKVVSISPASGAIWNKFTTLQVQFDRPVIPHSGKLTFTPESFSSGIMPLTPSNEKATTTLTLPLILSTSGKLIISDFISESGATSEPYEIEFALSSKSLSAEKEDSLLKFEEDTNFINLIENIQKASKNVTSVSEKVFTTSISDNSFRAEYGIFRFQQPKQFYCDISEIINIPFKLGSDGENCWFFSDSTEQRKNGEIRFYMTPCSDVNDIDIKLVRPFSTRKEPVAIIRSNKLEYLGKETVSNTQCEVIRSYRLLNDHFPRITTYWFDAEKFLPVRIIQTDTNKYQFDFVYDSLNTPLSDKQFQYDGPDSYTAEKPEALDEGYTERSIIVHDGSDGRMSGRWGKKGPKGTSSSGLN